MMKKKKHLDTMNRRCVCGGMIEGGRRVFHVKVLGEVLTLRLNECKGSLDVLIDDALVRLNGYCSVRAFWEKYYGHRLDNSTMDMIVSRPRWSRVDVSWKIFPIWGGMLGESVGGVWDVE